MEKAILIISAICTFLVTYFLKLGMDNVEQYLALVGVILFDGFMGIWRSIKEKDFRTYRAINTLKKLFTWFFILTISLLIEQGFPEITWISETLVIPFIIFEFISGVKNASLIGLIDLKFLKFIDQHKTLRDKDV